MIRRALYGISWACCALVAFLILGQPEQIGVQFRNLGVPGSIVDILLASFGVQIVVALSVVLLLGYGVPFIGSRLLDLHQLRKTDGSIAAARHQQRTLGSLEDLVQTDPLLSPHLSPVTKWASQQTSADGEPQLAMHIKPSKILTANQFLSNSSSLFVAKLLLAVTTVICLAILSSSSDRAFAEILSVSGTDYGTMLLGLRSATAAMAVAVFAALLIWSMQSLLDKRTEKFCQSIFHGLDSLAAQDENNLAQMNHLVEGVADESVKQVALDSDEKYLSLLIALQQSMAELQSLRADVDLMNGTNAQPMQVETGGQSVGRLTSAIRALKDATASELPQL
jgi:hypothetical protein